jgi:two-component system sensor histidine kinase/response regulator
MLKKINNLWLQLIGSPAVFPLERRIFHSITVSLSILAALYFPYNFFAGLYIASVSALLLGSFFTYLYYRSRYCGKAHNHILFGLTGLVLLGVNYFANSGINGSTDLIWPAYLLLVFAISPYKQHAAWLGGYLVSFLLVHFIAYYYPFLVKHPFTAGNGEFIDRITAFPLPVITIYIVIKFMRRSYDKEKNTAEEKANAIEIQNQQIVLQKQQLQQSNSEKDKLMSIISHDMRSPLIHIQSYLELLNENELDSLQRPALEQELLTATNSTLDMLSNLLHWSKSQMEGSSIQLSHLNLLTAIHNTLEMGKTQAAKKDIAFSYVVDPQLNVLADTNMLQLVIRNLISNAIKFTPRGGMITINGQLIQNECKITISDNGKGIDALKQGKIFSINAEPAFGTNNEKGVGLGLLLCKEFIEKQNGRIGFESIFEQGTNFFIFIPALAVSQPIAV